MRKGLWIWLAVAILPLSGCESNGFLPYARELEHMALMETMGVDGTEDAVTVTLSTGVQGGELGNEPPLILSATAQSISGSCHAVQSQGDSYVYYGHVGQVVMGEGLATTDITPVLDYVLQDVEMRLDTYLYVIEGTDAKTAMEEVSGESKSAPDRLEAMEDDVGLVDSYTPITVGDTIARLNRSGAVAVPTLKVEEGELVSSGYGIVKEGTLLGYVVEEGAKGTDLLMEEVTADIVEVTDATLRVVGSEVEITPNFQGNRLTGLTITCEVEANIAEMSRGVAVNEDALGAELAEIEKSRIWSAIHSAIALDADFLELELQATIAQPWHREEIETQWSLQDIPIEVTVVGIVNGEG